MTEFFGTVVSEANTQSTDTYQAIHTDQSCKLAVYTTTGARFDIEIMEDSPTEPSHLQSHPPLASHARRGTAKRGNTTYAGIVSITNALTVHDPNTGYMVLQSTPIDRVEKVA